MKNHLIAVRYWGLFFAFFLSEGTLAETYKSELTDYCIYSLERKSDKVNQLLDFAETGIDFDQVATSSSDPGQFTPSFKQHTFFARQSFTPNIVAKLNQIYLTVPEYANHLAELMLVMNWTFVENFKPLHCWSDNQLDTPVDIFKDYVAIPVSYGLIAQDDSANIFIDRYRFNKLDAVSKIGVIFANAVGQYLELGEGGYEPVRGRIKSRVANSFLFKSNIEDLKYQMERLSKNFTYVSKKGLRFTWGNCNYTQVEYPNISGILYKDTNYPRLPGWPESSYLITSCYKNYSDFLHLQQICEVSEKEFEMNYPPMMAQLDFLNKTVYSWLKLNLPGPYNSIGDFIATDFWAPGSLKFEIYPHYMETKMVDGFLMNYTFGFQAVDGKFIPIAGDSMGGGTYYPTTEIEKYGDRSVRTTFNWPQLMNWSDFSIRSIRMRKLFQDVKSTEFRCLIDPIKLYHLRKIQVESVK